METCHRLPLIQVDQILYPFVEGSFVCKTGKRLGGFFLVDSGSTENIFNVAAIHTLEGKSLMEKTKHISAIDNRGEECNTARIQIQLGDIESEEHFSISKNINFEKYFGKNRIIGLLGVDFLRRHRLVLDFAQKCIRPSEQTPLCLDDKSFVFPMGYGFKTYGIPVVGIIKGHEELLCIPDSGCNVNLLTDHAVKRGAVLSSYEKGKSMIEGIFGRAEARIARVTFSLLSIGKREGETILKTDNDTFQILNGRKYIATHQNENIPPISGLLSSDYMLQKKWVLDFGIGVIYSEKAS